ncbi:unnamed protein product [Bemisia tabaci]|uniref:DNA 3'-5' helicase n=1 Tax=Bemisia tabaci TaxID=7038 RepID=A0A9P0F747_BEMTA|nr:unnamed protein product [Bemisia tabaci]
MHAKAINPQIEYLKPQQLEAMNHIVNGRNTCLRLPTGFGKTIVFVVPFMVMPRIVVLCVPLVALLNDMFAKLRKAVRILNLRTTPFSQAIINSITNELNRKNSVFVITTPERMLSDKIFRGLLRRNDIPPVVFIFDEAHTIATWGVEFRPKQLEARDVVIREPPPQLIVASATLSSDDMEFIEKT